MLIRITTLAAATALLVACGSTPVNRPFDQSMLPIGVQVPAGHQIVMETVGKGEITYECRLKNDSRDQYEWVFVGPKATLMDRNDNQVGRYYGPPATWESMDGSRVTATQVAIAPGGTGNIPLQLVRADPAVGYGNMVGTTYIQRVMTKGGTAPSTSCLATSANTQQKVNYQADYIFYRAM